MKAIKPAAPGKRYIVYDAAVPQFGIRVTDKSTKDNIGSFVLVARIPGSNHPAPRQIGAYPAMGLAKAREVAREWREDIRQGVDPKVKEAERRREQERRRADTFGAAFETYAEERLAHLRTGAEAKRSIERHALPAWGARPISEIRRADAKELIRSLHKTAPIGGNRLLSILKTFFSWAAEEELIEASPAAAVKPLAREIKRDRVLADAEIRAIWQACDELGAFGRAFKFMLVTGQRRSEVGGMAWSEIDRAHQLWVLPRERTKADRAHEIPLSGLALSIIDECPELNEFVFSTGRGVTATGDATSISGWSKAKSRLDELAFGKAKANSADAPTKIGAWRLHDLRRTCATNLARLGVDRVVISKLLNHSEGGVTGIYDRHARDSEKRMAMALWGERLAGIVAGAGKSEADVIVLAKAIAR